MPKEIKYNIIIIYYIFSILLIMDLSNETTSLLSTQDKKNGTNLCSNGLYFLMFC